MLDKIGNKNPFTVPEGYFEQLSSELDFKIKELPTSPIQEERIPNKVPFIKKAKPYLFMAAMFVVIFLVLQMVVMPRGKYMERKVEMAESIVQPSDSDVLYSFLLDDEYAFWEYVEDEE